MQLFYYICKQLYIILATIYFTITGISNSIGNIRVGLYDSRLCWLEEDLTYKNYVVPADLKIKGKFIVPSGKYAIAAYQDMNKNNLLDYNLLGVPIEPFGFSNNPFIIGKPSFEKCSFYVEDEMRIYIQLKKFYGTY